MSGSSELLRLLAAERAVSPPPAAGAAGLDRLLGSVAAGVAPMPVAAGSLKLGLSLLSKWVGVGFMVGIAGAGVASLATPTPPLSAPPAQVARSAVPKPAVTAAVAPLGSAAALLEEPQPQPPASSPRTVTASPSTPTPTPEPESSTPSLDEELRLIAGAKRELDGNRAHQALAWLDEHRQRFPKGMLSLEREGLQALAGCSGGPRPELGRAFARQYPRSPMLDQILRRCGLAESTAAPSAGTFSESTDAKGPLGEPTSR
jgi:hypothetical protein